jgi:hypothetical protein
MHQVLERLAGCGDKPLDFQDLMYRYTLDSITEIAFGERHVCTP